MDSLLLNKDTLTEQVVARLEQEIRSGALAPLSRLKSTREMAAAFGVSQKVILFALDRLEEKKLLLRKEREGVFVSETAVDPGVREALIFVFGDTPDRSNFVRFVCDVVSSEAARGQFDFFSRFINLTYEQLSNRDYMRLRLKAELARISKQFHPSAGLIIGPRFDRQDVEMCLKLPFPLLFIGDFAEGDFSGLDYNRLGTSHSFYEAPLRWAAKHGAGRVALMASSILEGCSYYIEAVENMRHVAKTLGIETIIIPVENTHCDNTEKQMEGLSKAAAFLAKHGGTDVLLLNSLHNLAFLMECLRREGLHPLTNKLKVISIASDEQLPGIKHKRIIPSAVSDLHQHICDLMENLIDGKLRGFREQYKLEGEIVE